VAKEAVGPTGSRAAISHQPFRGGAPEDERAISATGDGDGARNSTRRTVSCSSLPGDGTVARYMMNADRPLLDVSVRIESA